MKNRKLILIVSLVLAMTMSLGGTLAYLTDTDADVNTMVLGNVKIEQHEYQRAENEDGYIIDEIDDRDSYVLEAFEDGKPLLPAIIPNGGTVNGTTWDYDPIPVRMSQVDSHGGASVFNTPNAVDKFVTVENTGKTNAYVRTLVAFEVGNAVLEKEEYPNQSLISTEIRAAKAEDNTNGQFPWTFGFQDYVEINGNKYLVMEMIYTGAMTSNGWKHENGVLPAGETTYPNLCQVYMASWADNQEVIDLDGNANGTYDILVLSQAVQVDGFAAIAGDKPVAKFALDTAFGEATADNVKKWFEGDEEIQEEGLPVIKTVSTAVDLADALNNVNSDTTIVLANDIMEAGSLTYYQAVDRAVTIDGNGYKYEGVIIVDGKSSGIESSALTIQDVNFVGRTATEAEDAYIMLGKGGDNSTRYTRNVTITNCTFEGDGMVAVKSYTGGDKYLVIEDCYVGETMHSLCQLKNVEEGLVIRNCTVEAIRGANLNNTFTALIEDCTFDVQKYAVRFGESANNTSESFYIKNTTLKSANLESDPVIEFRKGHTDAELTLENVTITGDPQFKGNEKAPIIINN